MEDLSVVTQRKRLPLAVPEGAYLRDHRFLGKAVLPAVESMELLAAAASFLYPEISCRDMSSIQLKKFFALDETSAECAADISRDGNGTVRASLVSQKKTGSRGITRSIEHVSLEFSVTGEPLREPPADLAAGVSGICRSFDKKSLYETMVPFGSAYQNVETAMIGECGASARVSGGPATGGHRILGSPFTVDAAFHAACAWGQCALNFTGFPVSLGRRTVLRPTEAMENYHARIFPTASERDSFRCDIWIYGHDGTPYECVTGLTMKDVAGLSPPEGISVAGINGIFQSFRSASAGFEILELDTVPDFADRAFSETETARYRAMGPRRKLSYRGSRIACKRLSRKLSGGDEQIDPKLIHTVSEGGEAPAVPAWGGSAAGYCSVSHDSRFVVAAAAAERIGIDVERSAERVRTTKRFYASEAEQRLAEKFSQGEIQGLLRVWTIKESAAKALGVTLAEAWKSAAVVSIGAVESAVTIRGINHIALHAEVEDHLFTMMIVCGSGVRNAREN